MSDGTYPPSDLKALLDEARGDGPSRERLDRVGAALAAQLGGGFASTAVDGSGNAAAPVPPGAATSAVTPTMLLARALTGGFIAVVAWLLLAREPAAPAPDASALPSSSGVSVETAPRSRAAVESLPPSPAAADPAPASPSVLERPATAVVPEPSAPASPPARAPRETVERVPAAEPARAEFGTSDPGSTLREEIALLERAMAARDAGDAEGALAVLELHRARFPAGILTPERERLRGELSAAPVAPETGTPDPALPP